VRYSALSCGPCDVWKFQCTLLQIAATTQEYQSLQTQGRGAM
jgi:hypothetical protein